MNIFFSSLKIGSGELHHWQMGKLNLACGYHSELKVVVVKVLSTETDINKQLFVHFNWQMYSRKL